MSLSSIVRISHMATMSSQTPPNALLSFDVDQVADESRNPRRSGLLERPLSRGDEKPRNDAVSLGPEQWSRSECRFERLSVTRGVEERQRGGAHQERCCLSIMQSSAINNDGVLTITF